MSLLNFNPSGSMPKGEKKSLKILLGIGALVGTIALGSTLAASINLNNSGPVEFGQGVTQTTACDDEILVTPYSRFVNDNPGSFKFAAIMLSLVDTTDQSGPSDGCAGKTFLIKLYKEDGSLINTSYTISVSNSGTFSSNDGDLSSSGENGTNSSVTLDFPSPTIDASDIYRITIESNASIEGTPTGYEVGDIGPGGGFIFYVSDSGFDCGTNLEARCNYLEAAPISGDNAWADSGYQWDGNNNSDVNTSMLIGSGLKNTLAMIQNDSTSEKAGTISRAFRGPNDFDDWFLPSYLEIAEMFTQQTLLGLQNYPQYWSSSGAGAETAFIYYPGGSGVSFKSDGGRLVRPIRAF